MLAGDIDAVGDSVGCGAHVRECKRLTNVKQPSSPITTVTTIAERLREARDELQISQEDLAVRAGVSPGTIGNIEAVTRKEPRKLVEIAAALQVTPGWLKLGKGPKRPTGWIPPQPPGSAPSSEGMAVHPVDQDLSQPQPDHELQQHTWEFILSAVNLPPRFRLAVPDDAMAPDTPRGTVLIFESGRHPSFGAGVLVQDRGGKRHIRRYAQGAGDSWRAEARNNAYLTLHSDEGLQVLAVVTAIETSQI